MFREARYVVSLDAVPRSTETHKGALEDHVVEVLQIRDGKVTEVWSYPGDIYAGDEFWP
jgi:ketosteroid isomerase-like protein